MNGITRVWAGLSPLAKGTLTFLTALVFLSIMDSLSKAVSAAHHPMQVVWARYASQTFLAFVILSPYLRKLLRTEHIWLQLLRSAFLFGTTVTFFTSLKYMHLASATAVFEIAPLFITIASFFILKEKVGLRRWIGVFLGLIGAMIIIRPGSDVFSVISLLPALAAFFFACYAISTRFLGADESPWTSFLYTAMIGTVVSTFLVPFYWTTPDLATSGRMMALGAFGGVGHFFMIRAFTLTEASFLAPFGYFTLLFNGFWGFWFFAEVPDTATIIGAAIIVSAGVYVWYRETFGAKTAS